MSAVRERATQIVRVGPTELRWIEGSGAAYGARGGLQRGAGMHARVAHPCEAITADVDQRPAEIGEQLIFTARMDQGTVAGTQHPKLAL